MKKIILILQIILLNFFNTRANSDSLTYKIDSICYSDVREINDSTFEKHDECLDIETSLQPKKTKEKGRIKLTKPMNWFEDAWDSFTDLFKPVWGHYTEDGFRSEGPYFLFDRKLEGPTYVQIQMQRIQDKIK